MSDSSKVRFPVTNALMRSRAAGTQVLSTETISNLYGKRFSKERFTISDVVTGIACERRAQIRGPKRLAKSV